MSPTNSPGYGAMDVRSLASLHDLNAALGRFTARGADFLARYRRDSERRIMMIEEQLVRVQSRAARLEAMIDDYRSDDGGVPDWVYDQAREVNEEMEAIADKHARASACYDQFLRRLDAFNDLAERRVPKAQAALAEHIEAIAAYHAVELAPHHGAPSKPEASSPPSGGGAASPRSLTDYPLPAGFQWVPLTAIDLTDVVALRPDRDYGKGVSYDTMRRGLDTLQREVLPLIAADPANAHNRCHELDRRRGTPVSDSLGQVYDVFFRSSFIVLGRASAGDRYAVTNGRHRLKAAIDLGWTAVPARTSELT